ncbi:MAG: hypothetical protein PHO10_00050 [Gemmiger sp.]|nr:hypothetical protein [Gemmiger sp.]
MDNDAKLVQLARDKIKGVLFRWKYRGVPLMDAAQGNEYIAQCIRWGKPFYAGRCGATEMRCMAEYLRHGGEDEHFSAKIRKEIRNLSGVFPTDDHTLVKFCEAYAAAAQGAALLALWDVGAERQVIAGCQPALTKFATLRALEPYYHERPWSAALAGKRVLVVHPFKKTILAQYQKRAQLFPGTEVLPDFASLTVVQAVQGLAGQDTGYATWFEALEAMQHQMDAAPYDVAIIGAGAYSLPLAAHAKATGHMAVQLSGATQLLFGIKGRRWDTHPQISQLYNDAWVRPVPEEAPQNKEKVEGGSYW